MSKESAQTEKSSNKFANDGSFMEMFRKQMEQKQKLPPTSKASESEPLVEDKSIKSTEETDVSLKCFDNVNTVISKSATAGSSQDSQESAAKKYTFPIVGKRRGANRSLKTGIVAKKPKPSSEDTETKDKTPGDAWSKYLQEVNAYKTKLCIEEDKSRPLVK